MKNKITIIGIVAVLALAASAWAADLAGKWIAQAQGTEITINFKVEGTALTGTLDNPQAGGPVEIKDGKIDGDNVSFMIVRKMGEMEMKISWKGKVAGDEIKFKREVAGGGAPGGGAPGGAGQAEEIIAKRAR
jgi:hypothetical protein